MDRSVHNVSFFGGPPGLSQMLPASASTNSLVLMFPMSYLSYLTRTNDSHPPPLHCRFSAAALSMLRNALCCVHVHVVGEHLIYIADRTGESE